MNESALILSTFKNQLRAGLLQTNPAVEQNRNIEWSESPWNQSGGKRKANVNICVCLCRRRRQWFLIFRFSGQSALLSG